MTDKKPSEKLYLVIGMAEQEEQEIMKVCLTKKEAISYAKRNLTDYEGVPIGESDATDMSNCIQEIEIPHKALLSAALSALDVVEKQAEATFSKEQTRLFQEQKTAKGEHWEKLDAMIDELLEAWDIWREALARARSEVKKKYEEVGKE